MLRKLIVIAVLAALVVFVARSGWALRQSGLLGSCTVYSVTSDGDQLEKCTEGKLDGRPDLSKRGCTLETIGGSVEYWSCPAPIGSAPAGI